VPDQDERSLQEEITVRGTELVDRIKGLIEEGNVRRLVVRRPSGEALIEIPLGIGVGVAALTTLMVPVLAALGAMSALLADFRVQIERDGNVSQSHAQPGQLTNDDADGETGGNGVEH